MKGGKIMEELFANVGNVGFPILITIYVLVRMEKKMDDLTKAISELTINIKDSDRKSYSK